MFSVVTPQTQKHNAVEEGDTSGSRIPAIRQRQPSDTTNVRCGKMLYRTLPNNYSVARYSCNMQEQKHITFLNEYMFMSGIDSVNFCNVQSLPWFCKYRIGRCVGICACRISGGNAYLLTLFSYVVIYLTMIKRNLKTSVYAEKNNSLHFRWRWALKQTAKDGNGKDYIKKLIFTKIKKFLTKKIK